MSRKKGDYSLAVRDVIVSAVRLARVHLLTGSVRAGVQPPVPLAVGVCLGTDASVVTVVADTTLAVPELPILVVVENRLPTNNARHRDEYKLAIFFNYSVLGIIFHIFQIYNESIVIISGFTSLRRGAVCRSHNTRVETQ